MTLAAPLVLKKLLGLRQRQEHEGAVEGRHADLEDRADLIGLHARRDAERRLRAVRGDQRDLVADAQRQPLGELGADRRLAGRVEAVERALEQVLPDARQALEVPPRSPRTRTPLCPFAVEAKA